MNTVEQFILGLDGQQKAIVSYLHHHITEFHGLEANISYGIPMYYRKTWVCYLNPIKKNGIELAFTKGHLLSNEQGILNRKKRKMVSGIDLYDVSELPEEAIREIIQEAIILDDMGNQKK